MKVTVQFEIDLKDTAYNIDKVRLIPVCLQNLGSWLNHLHLHYLSERVEHIYRSSPEMQKAMREHVEQDLKLSEQLFNNYKVSGTTEDGHTFTFTHQDPGYKERTIVDGKETYIEPCES